MCTCFVLLALAQLRLLRLQHIVMNVYPSRPPNVTVTGYKMLFQVYGVRFLGLIDYTAYSRAPFRNPGCAFCATQFLKGAPSPLFLCETFLVKYLNKIQCLNSKQ